MKIRTGIISSVIALALIGGTAYLLLRDEGPAAEPAAASAFQFEIADTPAEHAQGLSGRTEVPANYGLLFVFDRPERYGFWMKDMHVAIDILWLAEDGTILAIEEGVSPATYPDVFYPPRAVTRVLETRAGEARAQGWEVGTRVPLPAYK
ncbi:MAG TPA: DUF192 domain-containing protein [Candidatus Paceibacterota bacterium]